MIKVFVVTKSVYFIKTIQMPLLLHHNIRFAKICRQSEEALEMFEKNEASIILMDINWNRFSLSGFELLKKLIEYRPHIKVIGFTNSFEEKLSRQWKDAGGFGYFFRAIDDINEIAVCIKKINDGEQYFAMKNPEPNKNDL